MTAEEKAIIVTAPSGAGKTTLVKFLLRRFSQLSFSVSATSRPMRENEKNGVDYFFISEKMFRKKIACNEFIEYEEVYPHQFYGTMKVEISRMHSEGKLALFDVDVKGALALKNYFGGNAISIFIKPPSFKILQKRLESRATESQEKIRMRVKKAALEMQYENKFDCTIINDNLEKAEAEIAKLVSNFLI